MGEVELRGILSMSVMSGVSRRISVSRCLFMPTLDTHFRCQNKSRDRNWGIVNFDHVTYFDAENERRAWKDTFRKVGHDQLEVMKKFFVRLNMFSGVQPHETLDAAMRVALIVLTYNSTENCTRIGEHIHRCCWWFVVCLEALRIKRSDGGREVRGSLSTVTGY